MRKIIFLVLFVILSLFAQPMRCFALSVGTHEAINEYIVKNSVGDFSLGNYLNSNLDFSKGYEEYVNGHEVYIWLRDGGRYEDKPPLTIPYSRSFNHYLNPINNTGYQGVFKSALEWSHSQGEFGSLFGGDYSWPAVRSYYLNALISPDKATRDNYFAETFRGVGQLMHLVEDMSVPAHTRNDGHILYNYEDWVEDNSTVVANGSANPVYFSGAMSTYDPLFLDLAAFSNANFLTDDTIFSGFTYPRIEDTELWTDTANNRDYLRKLASSTGVQVDHLAASSWLYFYRLRYFPATDTFLPLGLDDKVYSDYAALLIPRAVGYSAGLINYFFRGQIDMKPDTQNAGKYVIENLSNEDMSGAFSLYYDDANGNRKLVQGADLSAANNVSIAPGASSASIPPFTEPTDAKEKGKYMLVFSGALGAEEGAVAGKVVTLIPCPKPGLPSDIDIIGSDAPQNGSQYTASGGVEPYSWAITKGSITQNGVVTVSNQCGGATITVTDICGKVVSKQVRMPIGNWITIYSCAYHDASPFLCRSNDGLIVGNRKYYCTICWDFGLPTSSPCLAAYPPAPIYGDPAHNYVWTSTVYEWRCQ